MSNDNPICPKCLNQHLMRFTKGQHNREQIEYTCMDCNTTFLVKLRVPKENIIPKELLKDIKND